MLKLFKNRKSKIGLPTDSNNDVKNQNSTENEYIVKEESNDKKEFKESKSSKSKKVEIGSLDDAVKFVQEKIMNVDNPDMVIGILRDAQARMPGAKEKTIGIINNILYQTSINKDKIDEYSYEVYKELWGLSVLEELYENPEIDEVRVNSPDKIYVVRKGKNERVYGVSLRDNDHIMQIINRLYMRDRIMLTVKNPKIECVLKDGSRLTATCPPLTPQGPTFVIRKHGTFKASKEEYIERQSMNERLHDMLALLTKGQANMLIIGPGDTGKSTLLRYLIRYLHFLIRIISMETDVELKLNECYPERDIVEFEEQPDIEGLTMAEIFPTILRYTPNIILLGEVRRVSELLEAVNCCVRGHSGAMITVHYRNLTQALYFLASMLVTGGYSGFSIEQAKAFIGQAFNIGVVLDGSSIEGIRKVVHVGEIISKETHVEINDLAVWKPSEEGKSYFEGDWIFPNNPSQMLVDHLLRYGVTKSEMREIGWQV